MRQNAAEINALVDDMTKVEERIKKLEDVVVAQSEHIAVLVGKMELMKVVSLLPLSWKKSDISLGCSLQVLGSWGS